MKKLFLLLFFAASTAFAGDSVKTIDVDERVVQLPGCTGFFVDGNFIFTAKHCLGGLGNSIKIEQKDGTVTDAKLVYTTPASDGPIVYYLPPYKDTKRYNSYKLSSTPPKTGDLVHAVGFPGGNYAITYGKITGGNGRDTNYASMRVQPGNSGGPLLNEKDEAIGVVQAVDIPISSNQSYFGAHRLMVAALKEAKAKVGIKSDLPDQPKLVDVVIFTADWCGSCQTLDREVTDEDYRSRGLNPIRVKENNGSWSNPALVAEFKQKTGRSVTSLPTIWIRGTTETQVGYASGRRLSLLGWIVKGIKGLGTLIFGNGRDGEIIDEPPAVPPRGAPAPAPPSDSSPAPPQAESSPVPVPGGDKPPAPSEPIVEEIDWENVSIILAAKKQLTGYSREAAARIMLKSIKGPIARMNAEFFDGKANIEVVDERTQPIRYESFTSTAGIDPNPFYLMVLVKKQSLGLKSLIAGKVERSVLEKVPEGTPLEIVFERIHKESYVAITKSLEVFDEQPVVPTEAETTRQMIMASVKEEVSGLKSEVASIVVPSKEEITSGVLDNIGPAIQEIRKDQDENGEDRSFFQRVIAALLALVAGGQVTGGVRGFLKARMMKKLKDKLHGDDEEKPKPEAE